MPISCWIFRSPWHMYETVDFSFISRPYLEFQTHLEQCHYYGIDAPENSHKLLTPFHPWQTTQLISKSATVITSKGWALCSTHCWGQRSTAPVLSRSWFEVEQEHKHQHLERWSLVSSHSSWGQAQIQCWLHRLSYELAARDPKWKKLWTAKGKGVLCSFLFFVSITFWQSRWTLV